MSFLMSMPLIFPLNFVTKLLRQMTNGRKSIAICLNGLAGLAGQAQHWFHPEL
jgi:hypothetical protein